MKTRMVFLLGAAALLVAGMQTASASIYTWIGNTDANASTAANWNPDTGIIDYGPDIIFGAAGSSGTTFNWDVGNNPSSITFNGSASAYSIQAAAPMYGFQFIATGVDAIANNSPNLQTFPSEVRVFYNGSKGFNANTADLTLGPVIFRADSMGGWQINTLTLKGDANGTIGGRIFEDPNSNFGSFDKARSAVVKTGSGTWTLANWNHNTGPTTVSGGTLALGNVYALLNSTLDTGASGSQQVTFTVAGANTYSLGGLQGSDDLNIGNNTLSVGANRETTTYSGALGGSGGALIKGGSEKLTLSGTNSCMGTTTVAAGTLLLQGTTGQLLTDNFNADYNPNTMDINDDLAIRQTGSAANQTWTGAGNVQVGNSTPVGQPYSRTPGDYLLLAFGGNASLMGMPLSTANVPGPLKVSFDMFKGLASSWTSFTITKTGNYYPVVGSGEFGMYYHQDSAVVLWNNGTLITYFPTTSGGDSFGFYLTDSAGTGSPFAGNGTKITVTQGANTLGSYTLDTGMGTSYLAFGANGDMIGGVDNLAVGPVAIQTNVLSQTTAVALSSGSTLQLADVDQTVASLSGAAGSFLKIGTFSTFTVNGSADTSFAGAVSGSGSFAKAGAGTLTLNGANTYTGDTHVQGGTLKLGILSVPVPNASFETHGVLTDAQLDWVRWDYAPNATVPSAIWSFVGGAGLCQHGEPWVSPSATIDGTTVAFLQGVSSINNTISIPSDGQYRLSFLGGKRVANTGGALYVYIDGANVLSYTDAQMGNESGAELTGDITLSAGTHTLTLTSVNGGANIWVDRIALTWLDGSLGGSLPAGTALTVDAGAVLDMNGYTQSLAQVRGKGLVSNGTVRVTGNIAPGGTNEVGTLTLAAKPLLGGATLSADVASGGSADRLAVQGDLDLTGLSLAVANTGALETSQKYIVATCTGALSGEFSGHNLPKHWSVRHDAAGKRAYLFYTGGTLILVL